MSESVVVKGTPVQYECDAFAGIGITEGTRYFGTRIKWRKGTSGRWNHFNVVDLHPFDSEGCRDAVVVYCGDRL